MSRPGGKTLAVKWHDGTPVGHLYHTGPIYFTYDPVWLAEGHNLSPLMLPFDGRNHAFLYDRATRAWRLSPAFDLTYSPGALSRGLTIAGEVRPDANSLAAFLRTVAIAGPELTQLSDQVLSAIARWPEFAAQAALGRERAAEVGAAHRQLLKRVGRNG